MIKEICFVAVLFLSGYCYSQRIGTKGIDSTENVINKTYKSCKLIIDSGKLYNKDSSKIIGYFRKSFYINTTTGKLDFAQYMQRLTTETSIYESFYFSNDKPMTAYRMIVSPKALEPEQRFLITGNTYLWKGHTLTNSTDSIRQSALRLLQESKEFDNTISNGNK